MDVTERQGAIAREAGSCVLLSDLEAHRMDWRRVGRIILNSLVSGYGRCKVIGDDAEGSRLQILYTSDP